ncbi:MAG: heavy metal sensor histidine kinase [Acidobacteria bacterium]|nr:heavy metal sensor histidine kinase [Acidobacteriota bacterium]
MPRWRPRSVRLRLALWYSAAVGLVVLIYAAGVYTFVSRSLREELDRSLHDDFEIVEQSLETARASDATAWSPEQGHHTDGSEPVRWSEVWGPVGELRFRSPGLEERPAPPTAAAGYEYASVVGAAGMPLRTLSGAHSVGASEFVVRVTRSEEGVRHELNELLMGLGLGLPIAVVLAGVGGYQLARRALRPVEHMTEQAQSITADHLRARLPVDNPDDELGRLATVFNEMLNRIEEAFERLRRFTADASHELRTPLTAIRSVGEVGLRERDGGAAYREVIGSMLEETDRLTGLVDRLLFLSRADSGRTSVRRGLVPLLALAREVTGHLSVLAEERAQTIDVEGEASIEARADPMLIREALINLVDNAIKYSPRGARVHVRVFSDGREEAALEVTDTGPGIDPEHHARIFERFYRVDQGRSRDQGGSGLGLAIARWAVAANGGRIELESEVGRGSTFRIVLASALLSSQVTGTERALHDLGQHG